MLMTSLARDADALGSIKVEEELSRRYSLNLKTKLFLFFHKLLLESVPYEKNSGVLHFTNI